MSARNLIEVIDLGDSVVCDDCSTDYEGSLACGGLLFQSRAICPLCAPKWEAAAIQYGEQRFIRGRCPPGVTFHAWVMGLRGGDNTVRVYTT